MARLHDAALLDAIEELGHETFQGEVWRVVRSARDPLEGSVAHGRWSDGDFEVLYTSLESDTALEEIYFHIFRNQPIVPSRITYNIYQLNATNERTLKLLDMAKLKQLGVPMNAFSSNSAKVARAEVYPATQAIAAAANFLGYDGLLAPSARCDGRNLTLFIEQLDPANSPEVMSKEPIDWNAWKATR